MWNTINDALGRTIFHPQYFAKKGEYVCIAEVVSHAKGTFLDIGCGRQWYRPVLEPLFKKYLALDHPQLKSIYKSKFPIELEGDAQQIPLGDRSVDVALMNLVIEHVPDPEKALQEVKRVLKKNGMFILFAVENYPVHGDKPITYQHFTRKGLEVLFARQGFTVKKIQSFGNFWQTVCTFQNVYVMDLVKKVVRFNLLIGFLLLCLVSPFLIMGNIVCWIVGGKDSREFSLGHVFVFTRI